MTKRNPDKCTLCGKVKARLRLFKWTNNIVYFCSECWLTTRLAVHLWEAKK